MPAPYSAGSVFMQVVPSFAGVQEEIGKHAERHGRMYGEAFDQGFAKETKGNLGKSVDEAMKGAEDSVGRAGSRAGKKYADGFAKQASDRTGKELVRALDRTADDSARAGEKSARSYAGKFANTLRQQLSSMEKQVLAIRVDAEDADAYASLERIKVAIASMRNAKIGVDFSAEDATAAMVEMEGLLDAMSKHAVSIRTRVDADQAAKDAAVIRKMVETVFEKPVDVPITVDPRQLGAFERELKGSLATALKSMPPLDLDDTPAAEKVRQIRKSLIGLNDARIGIDISGEQALAQLALIQAAVQDLNRSGVDIKTRYDSAQLLAALDAAQARVNKLDGSKADIELRVKDVKIDKPERLVGNFERTFRQSIENALKNLPPIELDVDDASVSAEVDRIRRELATLRDARLGIDLSSDDALARLRTLMKELSSLDGKTADVRVRSDVGTTYKELRAVFALVEALEHKDAKVKVSAPGAAGAAAGLRAVNSEAKKTNGNGVDAANAFRAFNIRILGFLSLAPGAIPLLAGLAGGLAALGPAALVGAGGLGVGALALSGIGDAVKGLNAVEQNAVKDGASRARSMQTASRGVRDAEQALSRARQNAADSTADAGRRVEDSLRSQEDAEQNLRDAQADSEQAQRDLTAARQEGADQLEDLALKVRGGALAERAAALDLAKAQAEYISTMADGSSTNVEREEVSIQLEREKLGYEEAVLANKRLQEQKAHADATGVEGTQAYTTALDGVATANAAVEDAQDGVASAQRDVADAQRDAARASRDASQSIADATQGLVDAQQDYQDALTQTDEVGSAATRNLETAMSKLGPAGRDFALFLHGLQPTLEGLRATAQEGFLPGLQGWMETITGTYGPQLQRTIGGLSGAMGDVFGMFGESLTTKPFQDLFQMIETDGPRFIKSMGQIMVNLGEGVASLLVAMEPFTDLFLGWFNTMTADFAAWAAGLRGSSGLQSFFDYVQRIGPEVGAFLKALGDGIVNLGIALAPYGEIVLNILTGILDFIGDADPAMLGAIAVGLIGIGLAMQTIFGLTSLVKSFEAAWRLATGTFGGFAGKMPLIAGGVVALAVGIGLLYMNSETFRGIVDSIFGAISDFVGAVNDVIGPVGMLTIAIGGLVVAKMATGWLSALRTPTNQLGTAAQFLGGQVGGATGKLQGMLGVLGGPWGIALAAAGIMVGSFMKTLSDAGKQEDAWAQSLLDGGKKAQSAMAEYQKARDKQPTSWMADLDEWTGLGASMDDAKKKADELYKSMSPIDRAQQDVTTATNDLALAQEKYGIQSGQAQIASENLAVVQDRLKIKQENLETATTDATEALTNQANAMLTAASSDLAMSNAQLAAEKAQKRLNDVRKDPNASPADIADAENALRGSYLQVASAALQQATDTAKLKGETLTATDGANAQLDALIKLRDEMGGNAPEAINTLIAGLQATAGMAAAVTGAVDGVTGAVNGVPGDKTVTVNGMTDPAKQALTDLGVTVQTWPDGEVTLTATDDPAQAVLDTFVSEANKRTADIKITTTILDDIFSGRAQQSGNYHGESGGIPGLPGIPGVNRATGGPISGPGTGTSDSVPILASDGEYVVKASSVSRYGLAFMDLINAGRFATGGLVGDQVSIPRWSKPADISAMDTTPLAAMWGDTIDTIGSVSGDAAPLLASMWAALRDSALGSVSELRTGATEEWAGLYSVTQDTLVRTRTDATSTWGDMTDQLRGDAGAALASTEDRFREMDRTIGDIIRGTRDTVGTVWGDLRSVTADPVNFVINSVLNGGLFAALNSVATTFGLDKTIPPATPVTVPHLATGGRVPGFSPTATADNIPSMLTAGEFVQPVSTVGYYGEGFMEALRQRRIPRSALPHFATGGLVGGTTWQQLDAIRAQLFPGSVMTSGYRPGAADWHGKGDAIDIGVPGNDPAKLAPIARRLAMLFPNATELINNPGGSIKDGRTVSPSFWGPATWAAHANHVHFAMTQAALAANALGVGGLTPSTAVPVGLLDSLTAPIAEMFSRFRKSDFTQLLADAPKALATGVWTSLANADPTAVSPTLYDNGGYLPPGLSMVLNGTGKPEPVLTAQELALMREGGGGTAGDTWDVDIHEPGADAEQIVGTLMHKVRVIKRGGKYGRKG